MAGNIGVHALISGRVQGVWFRRNTQEKARQLELVGYAKNLADGRVEVKAFGPQKAVEALIQWLHDGPPLARVKSVKLHYIAYQDTGDFLVQ